ncbi:sensor histidine kinase [Pseudolabrys taiwanensis]|nr:HAMP domain-containing sensor histidine kinase [Pseudolabrys taiwanensis]
MMRWRGRWRGASLSRRLLLGAALFIALALLLATFAIGFALHRFVQGQIDQRLDTQIVFLQSQLHMAEDGTLRLSGAVDGPPFDRPQRGWYWQVEGPRNTLRAASLEDRALALPRVPPKPPHRPPGPPPPEPTDVRPADGPGPDGMRLHYRVLQIVVGGAPVTILATAPRDAVMGPLRAAMGTLALSLIALGGALVLAMVLQVRLGLRPLERLRRDIAGVRDGSIDRIPDDQPREVQPVVDEINALLAQNAANLERARAHVANLAHGLKTPLATLALAVSERKGGDSAAGDLAALTGLMERRIRHHLGRARMAALNGPARARTALAPRIADLVVVQRKIYAERHLTFDVAVGADVAVACEQQDLDEMAGNLLDNACKWARTVIRIRAAADGPIVRLSIEDDGPGLSEQEMAQALRPGARLDESAPGFGFGLPIARELAELYGGELMLQNAADGGLRATLTLPRAAGAA